MSTFIKGPVPNSLKSAELRNLGWGSGKLLPLRSQTKPWESVLQILNFNLLSSPNSSFFWEKPLAFCWASCPATTHCSYGFVILNCLIHNLWEEMMSYELQITDSVQSNVFKLLHLPPESRGAFLPRDWEKGNFRFPGPHELLCEYYPRDGMCDSCLEPRQNIPLLWTEKKGHKHHLIPLVGFIWGDSYLSNSPTWNNKESGMGWVCTSGKGSFFLVPNSSLGLLSFHFSLLWLMLYSKLSLVKLIFFQRLQNRIHKGKS